MADVETKRGFGVFKLKDRDRKLGMRALDFEHFEETRHAAEEYAKNNVAQSDFMEFNRAYYIVLPMTWVH